MTSTNEGHPALDEADENPDLMVGEEVEPEHDVDLESLTESDTEDDE